MVESRPKAAELAWMVPVLAALAVVYLPSLGNGLVYDDGYLADGELLRDYASPFELKARWLSYGSFVWLQELVGAGWWKQRAFNLVLHAGVVVALWALYRRVLRYVQASPAEDGAGAAGEPHRSPALGLAIAVFALNPVAVYAVAYLIQRSIVMATLFTVLALWCFVRAVGERRPLFLAGAFACYALAVASKEHAVLAPLAAVPLYVLVARPSPARLAALFAAGAAIVAAAAFVLSYRYGDILGKPFDEYSHVYLAQLAALAPEAAAHPYLLSVINEAYLFFHYGLRWFLPLPGWMSINLRPPFPVSLATFPHVLGVLAYLAVVAGGAWLLLRHRDWRALVGASLLMPALLFATEFATVWVQDPFVLYRSYLWAIGVPGIVFALAYGTSARVLAAIGLVLGIGLAWMAGNRVASLATPETAWTDAIRKLPDDARAVGRWFPYLNRGAFYAQQNQLTLALRDFEASAALGDLGMGSFNAGSVLAAQGKPTEALAAFAEAERQGYRLYNLPVQRALALAALNRPAEAFAQLGAARAANPPSPTRELVLLQRGRLAMQLGKPEVAEEELRHLLALEPGNRDAPFLLSMALVMRNKHAEARDIADRLVREDPSGGAYYARALAHYGLKRKPEALADIDQALRLSPDNPNLREWRARIESMP